MRVLMRMYGVIQATNSPSKAWGSRRTIKNTSPSPPLTLLAHAHVKFKHCCSVEGEEVVAKLAMLGGGRVTRGVGGVLPEVPTVPEVSLSRAHGAGSVLVTSSLPRPSQCCARGVLNFGM